jgi:hypothetical protein
MWVVIVRDVITWAGRGRDPDIESSGVALGHLRKLMSWSDSCLKEAKLMVGESCQSLGSRRISYDLGMMEGAPWRET